jgi:hypothetical protein
MKRLAVILFALIAFVGALSSHGNSHKADNASIGSTPLVAGPTRSAPHHAAHVHYTACDQNISAGPHTTCGFANNVFRAFAHEAAQGSEEASVTATSPATGKAYMVRCGTTHGVTVCTGGSGARVRFPLWAAKVYNQPAKPENESNASTPRRNRNKQHPKARRGPKNPANPARNAPTAPTKTPLATSSANRRNRPPSPRAHVGLREMFVDVSGPLG